jgi:hypothetical protein
MVDGRFNSKRDSGRLGLRLDRQKEPGSDSGYEEKEIPRAERGANLYTWVNGWPGRFPYVVSRASTILVAARSERCMPVREHGKWRQKMVCVNPGQATVER